MIASHVRHVHSLHDTRPTPITGHVHHAVVVAASPAGQVHCQLDPAGRSVGHKRC